MKDYEKAALGIGAAALGIAAYQAYKAKEAVDATQATDPSRNPVQAAIERSQQVIGTTYDWFRSKFDEKTGYVKGKVDDVSNTIKATPANAYYWIQRGVDFGKDATESGTKYVWSLAAEANKSGKEKVEQLTNKGFTLMGSVPTMYKPVALLPHNTISLENIISGIGTARDVVKSKTADIKDRIYGILPWRR